MKKLAIFILKVLALLIVLLFALKIGLNYWLKNKLPEYLKNNPDFSIVYSELEVNIFTGNVLVTDLGIKTKKNSPENTIINGTVKAVEVTGFGFKDLIVDKKIFADKAILTKPKLEITFVKKKKGESNKKAFKLPFANIDIRDGDLKLYKSNHIKVFSGHHLNCKLDDIKIVENPIIKGIPFEADKTIVLNGKQVYLRVNTEYLMKATSVGTNGSKVEMQNFELIRLISPEQYFKFFPHSKAYVEMNVKSLALDGLGLGTKKFKLENLLLNDGVIHIAKHKTEKKKKKKPFHGTLDFRNLVLDNVSCILEDQDNHKKVFSVKNIHVGLKNFFLDDSTLKEGIPFNYKSYEVTANDLFFASGRQSLQTKTLLLSPEKVYFTGVKVNPLVNENKKGLLDFTINSFKTDINVLDVVNDKASIDLEKVWIDGLNGTFQKPENQQRKEASFANFNLPIKVGQFKLSNSNIHVNQPGEPINLYNLNALINGFEINEETIKNNFPVKVKDYTFSTEKLLHRTKFYTFKAGKVQFGSDDFMINDFAMTPNYSRKEFEKMIPVERDLYTISIDKVDGKGKWKFTNENQFLDASEVDLIGVNANIYRSKVPKDDPKPKNMYSTALANIKFPLFIKTTNIKNSILVYEEETAKSRGPGKLTLSHINAVASNLNSAKMEGRPTQIPIIINCKLFDTAPLHAKWVMDTKAKDDAFSMNGYFDNLPADKADQFITPYAGVMARGTIDRLVFDFTGNRYELNGLMEMRRHNLEVYYIEKTGFPNDFISKLANFIVKGNDKKNKLNVAQVDHVKRDNTKSFFNLFWKGIQEGLAKILISPNIEKDVATLKKMKAKKDARKAKHEEKKHEREEKKEARKERRAEKKAERLKKKNAN